jgi:hypothetical protein
MKTSALVLTQSALKRAVHSIEAILCLLTILGTVCWAQPTPSSPGPLTEQYSFGGVSFQYPSNWTVKAYVNRLVVAPPSAFVAKPDGKSFVTHGFFFGLVDNPSTSLDEMTTRTLQSIQRNSPQLQTNSTSLTRIGSPIRSSCGTTFDPNPPYPGTETGTVCTYRVGALYVWTMMFSPTNQWEQYRHLFESIVNTFSAQVTGFDGPAHTSPPAASAPLTHSPVAPPSSSHLAGQCESGHWIESVGGDGKIIKLENGSMWEVDDIDTVDTAIWLPITNVVICGTKMLNVDDNESAEVKSIISPSTGSNSRLLNNSYVVQASANDETFVINGKVFKSKTYCFNFEKDDKVIFLEGSALGGCVSAKLLNLRTEKVCNVWCE